MLIFWIFFLRIIVVQCMMWHAIGFFLSNFVFFLALLCVKNCNFLYFMDKFYLRVWKHGDFLISVFQYMDIGKYPCIETRRCHNCHVSIHGDRISDFHRLAISVFQYMVIAKLSCIKHGYFWICMFQYMDLEKYPCIETRRCHNCHVSIHGDSISDFDRLAFSVFQYMVVAKLSCINRGYFWICMFQYMVLAKYPCIETRWCSFFDAPVTPHPGVEPRWFCFDILLLAIFAFYFRQVHFLVPYKSKGAFIITALYTVILKRICNFYQEGNVPMFLHWEIYSQVKQRNISVFLSTDIVPYPWVHTRIWCNWSVKKGTSPCFYTRIFCKNQVLKHADSKISANYTR